MPAPGPAPVELADRLVDDAPAGVDEAGAAVPLEVPLGVTPPDDEPEGNDGAVGTRTVGATTSGAEGTWTGVWGTSVGTFGACTGGCRSGAWGSEGTGTPGTCGS